MTAELATARKKRESSRERPRSRRKTHFAVSGDAPRHSEPRRFKAFFCPGPRSGTPIASLPTLADVKDVCAKVFSRMSEAHQTLMDPAKRAKYEATLQGRWWRRLP